MKKLIYTRGQYFKMVDFYEEEVLSLKNTIKAKEYEYLDKYDSAVKTNYELSELLENNKNVISGLKRDIRLYKKEISNCKEQERELREQINELQAKIEEAELKLSQRYILKELRPSKPRKTQTMQIKSSSRQSNAIKIVKEK